MYAAASVPSWLSISPLSTSGTRRRIGLAMGVMGFAGLASQAPAGALIDHTRNKRALVATAFTVVAAGALAMVMKPIPVVVLSAQVLIGMVGATFGPALAAISLGLVGHEGLA